MISLYHFNLTVFITEAECLLRCTSWILKSDGYNFVLKRLSIIFRLLKSVLGNISLNHMH
jgi:hypothetical protein